MNRRVSSPRFVGRFHELDVLQAGLEQARLGHPQAIFIGGEAGVGKTRLAAEFNEMADRSGAWTLLGRCIPTRGGLAFAPVVEMLRRLSRELAPAMFDHIVGGARQELARLVPELGHVAPQVPPLDLELDATRGRLFELVLGMLGRLANESSVVMTIEDLHWSDRSSQDLVSFLVRELDHERVLLVGTYRTDELAPGHPVRSLLSELAQTGRAQRVELRRFDRAETLEQVAAISDGAGAAELADRIHDRSEGNPFFTEELLGAARDHADLPDTVSDALLGRVATLSEVAREVLRVAAVAGRQVEHRMLSAASAMAEPQLTLALREAVDRHVLLVDADSYAFRHALLQETVYRSLLPGERTALHEAYARALTAQLESAVDFRGPAPRLADARPHPHAGALAELAHHWQEAGDAGAALRASLQAARAAYASYAFAEARFQFERVLSLRRRIPGAADQLGVTEVDLLDEAARAADLQGDHERAIGLMREALEQLAADPAPANDRVSLVHDRLGHYLWAAGRHQEAFANSEEAVRTAPPSPSVARARALTALARTRMLTGRLTDGRALAEEALEAARPVGAHGEASTAHQVLGLILVLLGEPDVGLQHLQESNRIAVHIDHVGEIVVSSVTWSVVLSALGRLQTAETVLRDAIGLARERGFERSQGLWLKANLASVLARLGSWGEADRLAADVVDPRRDAVQVAAQLGHVVLGQVGTGRGDLDAARAHLDLAQATRARQWIDRVPAAIAELEIWAGRWEQARAAVAGGLAAVAPGNETHGDAAVLCWLGVRVEADRAQRARVLSDGVALADAMASGGQLRERVRSIVARGSTDGAILFPEVAAAAALAEAEHSRLEGSADPDLWDTAARQLHELRQPFWHAYARWREAEAGLVAQADRERTVLTLRTAHGISADLGAQLLAGEIEQLARRARIVLSSSDEDPTSARAAEPEPPAAKLGLTAREIDVLALLAEGRTNAQIGEALFISDKTASVHVSHILSKLGATNRVEAAGIAYRLSLLDQPT